MLGSPLHRDQAGNARQGMAHRELYDQAQSLYDLVHPEAPPRRLGVVFHLLSAMGYPARPYPSETASLGVDGFLREGAAESFRLLARAVLRRSPQVGRRLLMLYGLEDSAVEVDGLLHVPYRESVNGLRGAFAEYFWFRVLDRDCEEAGLDTEIEGLGGVVFRPNPEQAPPNFDAAGRVGDILFLVEAKMRRSDETLGRSWLDLTVELMTEAWDGMQESAAFLSRQGIRCECNVFLPLDTSILKQVREFGSARTADIACLTPEDAQRLFNGSETFRP